MDYTLFDTSLSASLILYLAVIHLKTFTCTVTKCTPIVHFKEENIFHFLRLCLVSSSDHKLVKYQAVWNPITTEWQHQTS